MNTIEKQALLKDLGAAIKEVRENKQVNVSTLAQKAAIEEKHLEEIESGLIDVPFTELVAIAQGLGVGVYKILPL
jgi:ribosome-binding protein aMBF1 (putative translation factor)